MLTNKSFLLMFSFLHYISGQLFQLNFIRTISPVLRTEEMAEKKIPSILSHFYLHNNRYLKIRFNTMYIASNVNWLDSLHNLNDHIKHFYSASFCTWSVYLSFVINFVLVLKPFSSAWKSASSIWAKCLPHVWLRSLEVPILRYAVSPLLWLPIASNQLFHNHLWF